MKLPTQIVTRHKVRDGAICYLYTLDHTQKEIGMRFKLNQSTIHRILYANRHAFKIDSDWEKTKRIHQLNRLETKFDGDIRLLNILEQKRKEIEGDKPLVDNSQHITTIIYTRKKSAADNRNELRGAELSG